MNILELLYNDFCWLLLRLLHCREPVSLTAWRQGSVLQGGAEMYWDLLHHLPANHPRAFLSIRTSLLWSLFFLITHSLSLTVLLVARYDPPSPLGGLDDLAEWKNPSPGHHIKSLKP
jgi:hypothetical protein